MRKFGGLSTGGNGNVVKNGVVSAAATATATTDQNQSQVSVGIRSGALFHKQQSRYGQHQHHHHRRLVRGRKISVVGALFFFVFAALLASVFIFIYFFPKDKDVSRHNVNRKASELDDVVNDTDFLTNVTRTAKGKVARFGHGSVTHGQDSRYWDGDDRRRDENFAEEDLKQTRDGSTDIDRVHKTVKDSEQSSIGASYKNLDHKDKGLYNEAGRNELKKYEAEYEASVKSVKNSKGLEEKTLMSHDAAGVIKSKVVDADDEYDDGIDLQDTRIEDGDDAEDAAEKRTYSDSGRSHSSHSVIHEVDESLQDLSDKEGVSKKQFTRHSVPEKRSGSKKKSKRHKSSGCEMKLLNSTNMLVEPLESRKFARFSLQYTETEEDPTEDENMISIFGGHQSLVEREESFKARDQKINCGFVSKGFDLAEDDAKYLSSCHIAVVSCIFGNSDRLRIPVGKMVSRISRKNVCFVMFVDEATLQALSSDGLVPDRMGYIGLWKIVVVRNLPYADMRRVGKIPKLLSHRLFPSARYSIWLDSKLRLQLDPLSILEYFLWRKGYEYAISNHYDRHCVWEEVAQNKKLNKYNHSVIDEQFEFYQADGLKRFNASDPNKLLPSNVPEGSLIVRAHTPMSNLFSCLWFNEVDRFTPRDQLSFAHTYYKLRRMNPGKPFYLNMFKDCERRKIAKLFRHRSQESRNIMIQHDIL